MVKLNKWFINGSLAIASIVGSVIYVNKNKKPREINVIPPFFTGVAPYLFAHRGGMAVRPEQTKLAFDNAIQYGVDGFETDVRLTKDNELIVFHDATVDRTTNGSGKVNEHTLEELRKLDAGYYFTDINRLYPFRGHEDAKILTFGELLELYPDMYINVDLKDHPNSYEGTVAPEVMYQQIVKHHAEHRVLVTSFHKEQIERFDKLSKGTVAIGASQSEVTDAFIKFNTFRGHQYQPKANTFQMPTEFKGIKLTSSRFIKWLKVLNIVPGYYGINSIDLMTDLYQKGAHTLVTDRPDLAQQFKETLK